MPIEFPPDSHFLPPGRHRAGVADIEESLVSAFPSSRTRRGIFDEWRSLVPAMLQIVPLRDHWMDGSYVTKKLDPNDVDVISHFDGPAYDSLNPFERDRFNELGSGKGQAAPHCDSWVIAFYPEGHEARQTYIYLAEQWNAVFGADAVGSPRGYIGLENPCLKGETT